jgi:chromosome segregation ATPase
MRAMTLPAICVTMIVTAIATPDALAARKKAEVATPLTEAGQKLEARYSGQLKALQTELAKSVPAMDEQKKSAYQKAREAEKPAEAAQKARGKVATAQALVNHAKGKWIGGADRGIATAQAKLKKATTEAERDAAQKELVKWQKNRVAGVKALKERQAAFDKAKLEEPKLIQELEAANKAFAQAQARSDDGRTPVKDSIARQCASLHLGQPGTDGRN